MLGGSLFFAIIFGVSSCGAFAVATYVGGWTAYACAAVLVLGLACAAAWIQRRGLHQVHKELLAMMPEGECSLSTPLGEAVRTCSGNMAEHNRRATFFHSALRDLGTPALVTDERGVIRLATRSLLELLGKSAEEVEGKSVSQAMYGEARTSMTEKALEQGRNFEEDADLALWNGKNIAVRVFVSLVKEEGGEVLGAVTAFIELTERVAHQKELEEQRERMVRAGEHISGLAGHVASATDLLSASADDQAQGAQNQRRQTASVAKAMEEIMETVMEVARNAEATREAATGANESAEQGKSLVDSAVAAINEVADLSSRLEREVDELDAQAGAIGKIISVINDIADQTNLLALNAAIEAARAGEAGRGFAVVADEVRKLAEKTVDATREVETAITMIQDRSKTAISSMEATSRQVAESTDLSGKAGEALEQIRSGMQGMVERVTDIATSAGQQSSATEQVMLSVEEIATIAEDADEAAGQAAEATREMAELARELLEVSKEFQSGRAGREEEQPHEMRGILPKMAQSYVRDNFAGAVHDAMQDELGNPEFSPEAGYPDSVLSNMANSVAKQTGMSARDVFLSMGRDAMHRFRASHPHEFQFDSLKEFFLAMNDIHVRLSKDVPGIKPPRFSFEDKGDDLFMNYRSSRGLFDYFEGFLLGAAEVMGESIQVAIKPFDGETARAEIVFLGKNESASR